MDALLTDALRALLHDRCTPARVREIEAGQSAGELWACFEESGFADALLQEPDGGAGLGLAEAFALLELCGAHAVPLPLAQTMVARPLLRAGPGERPAGSIALAQGAEDDRGGLRCAHVPCGRVADWVLVQGRGGDAVLLPVRQAILQPHVFPLDASLRWSAEAVRTAWRVPHAPDLFTLQACVAAAQLAGALRRVFELTLQYANERVQFGRPIGKFQAIQHQLAVMSEHVVAARMAAQIGCHADGAVPERLRVAVAKARASEAAVEVAALSHSIHGAIGFTEEFDLQLFTRRLHAWRQLAGAETYWHGVVGDALLGAGEGLALDLLRATTDVH